VASRVPLGQLGAAAQRRLGQTLDGLAHGGHPVAAQFEHRIERGSRRAVAGHPGISGISSHGRSGASHGGGSAKIARLIQDSVANTRCRNVSMNDHSPSTDSCSSSGGRRRARSTVLAQSASRMSHAAGSRPDLPGASWPGPDTAYFSSALIRDPMSTPSTVRSPSHRGCRCRTARRRASRPRSGRHRGTGRRSCRRRGAEVNALNRERANRRE
jgi:hypothetical protein